VSTVAYAKTLSLNFGASDLSAACYFSDAMQTSDYIHRFVKFIMTKLTRRIILKSDPRPLIPVTPVASFN